MIARATVRSVLGIARSGKLSAHVAEHTDVVGPKWTNKRDLAALAALAGSRQ